MLIIILNISLKPNNIEGDFIIDPCDVMSVQLMEHTCELFLLAYVKFTHTICMFFCIKR